VGLSYFSEFPVPKIYVSMLLSSRQFRSAVSCAFHLHLCAPNFTVPAKMLKSSAPSAIRLRGVRHNNLKNFDLDLPLNQLIVITGLSGSGKSSLAFDTLFAEGQRRYIETFSPYARQFFDRMDKPQVDSIEGIPPAIAIEQRNSVKTTRSTVGTMTEICDYMKMLWPHVAQLHCRQCGRPVQKDSPQQIWTYLLSERATRNTDLLITFDLPLTEKLTIQESLALISKQGYQRLLLNGEVLRLDEAISHITKSKAHSLTVIQDRLRLTEATRPRFIEACEQAYHFGKGKLTVWEIRPPSSALDPRPFSKGLHCAHCDLEYRDPSPALFSFNNPVGACPACKGFGRAISIDYDLVLPDRSRTLAQGVVKPWLTGFGRECQDDLMRTCRNFEIPTNVPFEKLPKKWQDFVINGEPDYGTDEEHEWPRAWYGIKGYFRWLESKSYKMHVRVLLSRYRAYTPCPACQGRRFQPEALFYRLSAGDDSSARLLTLSVISNQSSRLSQSSSIIHHPLSTIQPRASGSAAGMTLADFYQLPIWDTLRLIEALSAGKQFRPAEPLGLVLNEVRSRLGYLNDVGLGYLTLDRPTRSLSGGETERVNLTTCLGTRLVNTLFVLDEPSVGLHPRDTERLVRILQQLRDAGNTVVVVEHEASVMRAANQIVDLGPGHGATGGQVVFQGTYAEILKSKESLTGQYLSSREQIEVPTRRPVQTEPTAAAPVRQQQASRRPLASSRTSLTTGTLALNEARAPYGIPQSRGPRLKLAHATLHNLRDLSVEIPLGRFICITGVSGSGKTTLIREVLLPALASQLKSDFGNSKASDRLDPEGTQSEGEDGNSSAVRRHPSLLAGAEHLGRVVLVDQTILGKTPRSNPAVYIGAFDDIREFFAQSEPARQRGLNASAFSFNSAQGQCERCRGAGFEKIEMQFLSDVFIRCPDCNGRRYRSHILEIKVRPVVSGPRPVVNSRDAAPGTPSAPEDERRKNQTSRFTFRVSRALSIADVLDSTVEEAIAFFSSFPASRPAQHAANALKLLEEVGLGYLQLGQPINTLSGGESQRLKLVRHLAEAVGGIDEQTPQYAAPATMLSRSGNGEANRENNYPAGYKPTLFLFDEPTTGLHFDDVRVLLKVFQRLVDGGHSVVVIEHNLDVIKSADWIIDLGPEAGDQGGQIVAQGTPEQVSQSEKSFTGQALREVLDSSPARRTR
jgi:excinuclease ABC subunit A